MLDPERDRPRKTLTTISHRRTGISNIEIGSVAQQTCRVVNEKIARKRVVPAFPS
jgi:hypothetical protein